MNRSLICFAVLVIAVLVGFNNTSEWHHFDLIVSPTFTAALVFFGLYYTYKSALTKTTVTRSALFTMPKAEVHRSPYAPRYFPRRLVTSFLASPLLCTQVQLCEGAQRLRAGPLRSVLGGWCIRQSPLQPYQQAVGGLCGDSGSRSVPERSRLGRCRPLDTQYERMCR